MKHPDAVHLSDLPTNLQEVVAATELLRSSVPGIVGIALVGSWARAAGRPDSDVDLIVLTSEQDALLGCTSARFYWTTPVL